MILQKIRQKIIEVAEKENSILEKCSGKGIFIMMPELAFAYQVGKEIMTSTEEIFNNKIEWLRETDIGGGGPSDLIFKYNDSSGVVIEFKMSNTIDKYRQDIQKLQSLPNSYDRIFCALVDVFEFDDEKDGRIIQMKKSEGKEIERIGDYYSFPTIHYNQKKIKCLIGFWKIL